LIKINKSANYTKKNSRKFRGKISFCFCGRRGISFENNLMIPFARRQLNNMKRIYNYRQSRARRIVECAFGILTKRFNVFENKMLVHLDKAAVITQAACVLHNIIMDKEINLTDIHSEIETTTLQVYQEDSDQPTNRRPSREAIEIREKFMSYFNSEIGSVPWQNTYII